MNWAVVSGPSANGKTTLMYEVVALLRESGLEAVGATERVRLKKGYTHETLSTNPDLHFDLYESQINLEDELSVRPEYEIVVLDRCLLDYYVLARQTFPSRDMTPPDIDMKEYVKKFIAVYIPSPLKVMTGKERPDAEFRRKSWDAFEAIEFEYDNAVFMRDIPLIERAGYVYDNVLRRIGRSEMFRNWYTVQEVAYGVKTLMGERGEIVDGVYLTGSQCRKSPTLPGHSSDLDLFIETDVLGEQALPGVQGLIARLYGVNVQLTRIPSQLVNQITLLEKVL